MPSDAPLSVVGVLEGQAFDGGSLFGAWLLRESARLDEQLREQAEAYDPAERAVLCRSGSHYRG